MSISSYLVEPRLKAVDLTGPKRLELHRIILEEKKIIKEVFEEIYDSCIEFESKYFQKAVGSKIEIGAGTSFFKKKYPDIIATDIESAPFLDLVVDAQKMPFPSESVKAVFCINAFHHFPDPRAFFRELVRVLPEGGGCILLEPGYGIFSTFLYKRLFSIEGYDKNSVSWSYLTDFDGGELPNQALSYVVFFRDQEKFLEEFPELEIVEKKIARSYLRYFLSGGLNFRQLIPNWLLPLVQIIEAMLTPVETSMGLHHYVVLRKKKLSIK